MSKSSSLEQIICILKQLKVNAPSLYVAGEKKCWWVSDGRKSTISETDTGGGCYLKQSSVTVLITLYNVT